MPKNNSSINNSLFDLLKGKGYSPTMLSTAGKEIPTPDEAEVFQFNFVKDGEDYGKVTLTIDDSSNLIVYYSDDVADSEKETSGSGDLSWYGLLNQLKRFAQRYQLSFELRNTDNLKSDMAKRDYMKKQDQIAESKHNSMAEGINISNELKNIRSKSTKELDNLILFYTKALEFNPKFQQNRDLLDLVKMVRQERKRMNKQGMAEGQTGVSVKKWAAQVRQEHGADTKFWNDKTHDRVIARKDKEIVDSYDRKANNGTVFSPKQGVAEGYSLKKTNVEKTFDPGDPDEYTQDVNTTYTDYEIINNKTGQVVGTANWTTNDFMGPGALKITMKNGATRWLDIWEREKGNPQTAFNRFVKDPKTAKKYKEQDIKDVTEMDKSQTPSGRDGRVSHRTYGSRDTSGDTGAERTAKPITAKQATTDAMGILNKQLKKKDVKEMDNRTPSGDRREQRANSPEEKAKREKEQQANLKKVSPEMRKKLRLPDPDKEDVAEGLNDTQKKIEDTINKLEDRLKHAKSDEQWDRISARIERLQAGLKRSKQGVAEEATKKLSKGTKVYHTLHGTGTVVDFSTGPGASHWVDVKFIKDGHKGKITRVDRKQIKLAKVESVAEGDDRGDYRKTAREANAASRLAKSSKTHAEAARLHNLAATYALSAGQDQSVIRDHQMAAHEHNQAAKKYKKDVTEGADIEYIVVIRDGQGKRSIPISALTPTDAKAKAKEQGYKVLKVKDPNESHYFREQDMAESNQHVNESYYPMGKQGSYSDAVPTTKIIIQHSRRIEEGEQRYRNIAKIFVENSEGERFAVPTTKPGLARVYARHIAEGGTPYDERGRHITSLVEEYSKMSGFMRATRGKQFNESAQQLVTEAVNYYQSLRESLSKMTGHRGYSAYFESWTPALMEDGEEQETNLNELFVQETLDPRIESVMPILGKLQRKLGTIKEVDALAEWADNIIEGDGGQEALNPIGIPEATDVTDDNPKSQGGTRAELLRKYANTKKPKDAEAARRAGASQSELKAAADSTEEIHEGASSQDLQNAILYRVEMRHPELFSKYGHEYVADKALDVASFYAGAEEIGSSDMSAMVKHLVDTLKREGENGLDENLDADQKRVGQLGPTEKVGPKGAVGKLVGANESVNESEDELARILQMVKHKR